MIGRGRSERRPLFGSRDLTSTSNNQGGGYHTFLSHLTRHCTHQPLHGRVLPAFVIFHHLFIPDSMGYTTDGRRDSVCPVEGNSGAEGGGGGMGMFLLGPGQVRTSAPLYVLIR